MRIKIGAYFLNQKLKSLNIKTIACNLNQAKNIALVFNADSSNDVNALKIIEKYYRDKKIQVQTIGFSNSKHLNETFIGDKTHHFVCLKDFNWLFLPKKYLQETFLNNKFDILVNLYTQNTIAAEYLVRCSKAKFKVGSAHQNKQMHDLMIDTGDKKDDIIFLSNQVNYYLGILNT